MVDAAFTGFVALPAGGTAGGGWWDVLGVPSRMTTKADVLAAWRQRVMETHPDRGGEVEEYLAVNRAYAEAMKVVGQ